MKIFLLSGRAGSGKDATAKIIQGYFKKNKVLIVQYSSYIKEYAKKISNEEFNEINKPRKLLQDLGTFIKENIDNLFFVNRMIEDLKVYQPYFDIVIISDVRYEEEITEIKNKFHDAISISIVRDQPKTILSKEEANHITEKALDNFKQHDYIIENNESLNDLKLKIESLLEAIYE